MPAELVRSRVVRVRRFAEPDLADSLAGQELPEAWQHQPGSAMTEEQASGFIAAQAHQPATVRGAWLGRADEVLGARRVIGDVGAWVPSGQGSPVVGDIGYRFDPP